MTRLLFSFRVVVDMLSIDAQLAQAEAENARLKDERIALLQRQISVLQVQLDALLEAKVAEIEAVNRSLREAVASRKRVSPLKGRKVLEDYECAVSTFIARHGGVKIPKNLREEFGGWARLHSNDGLGVDEMAEALCDHGLIPEPMINALIDGLKSGRQSAREPSSKHFEVWAEEEIKRREADSYVPF